MTLLTSRLDLRHVRELALLADIVAAIRIVAPDEEILLIGAQARDVLLTWSLGIETARLTRDIDLAMAVENWQHFLALRQRLLDSGRFHASPEPQKVRFDQPNGVPVDIVPFAGVERPDRSIAWPPEHAIEMSAIGFRESVAHCIAVRLPGDVDINVVSLASFAALKLFAWCERVPAVRPKDATDLRAVLAHYDKVVGLNRLYEVPDDVLTGTDGDNSLMAAWLLGQHVAEVLAPPDSLATSVPAQLSDPHNRLAGLLAREIATDSRLELAAEMGAADLARNVALLEWLRRGLIDYERKGSRPA